jgi:hypothetical protein
MRLPDESRSIAVLNASRFLAKSREAPIDEIFVLSTTPDISPSPLRSLGNMPSAENGRLRGAGEIDPPLVNVSVVWSLRNFNFLSDLR